MALIIAPQAEIHAQRRLAVYETLGQQQVDERLVQFWDTNDNHLGCESIQYFPKQILGPVAGISDQRAQGSYFRRTGPDDPVSRREFISNDKYRFPEFGAQAQDDMFSRKAGPAAVIVGDSLS